MQAASVRLLVGIGCRELGDTTTATLELEAARSAFHQLGAVPDVERVETLLGTTQAASPLSRRESEVLALVAAGKSNRAVADELVISEKTVARHMSNIFAKLGVSSRSGAVAYAYRHGLVR